MGHDGGPGHCEIRYEDCRVPAANLLGPRQAGFKIAQDRLGPGRIHHCMRAIGGGERAIEMMCRRAQGARDVRRAAGREAVHPGLHREVADRDRPGPPADPDAAWKMDTVGKREARREISMIKVVAANV